MGLYPRLGPRGARLLARRLGAARFRTRRHLSWLIAAGLSAWGCLPRFVAATVLAPWLDDARFDFART
ncbi:MAG: hypothetical protein JF602_08955, partial [Gemmatimonadetes bacterium]|nr:hypothetical protein [Gemmatimonadota bacterium]